MTHWILFVLYELIHFRLMWYSAPQKADLFHVMYDTQASFNMWNQMYLPESEVADSSASYRLYFLSYISTEVSALPWQIVTMKNSSYMHTVSARCQIISAFNSPTSWISLARTWHWWLQTIPFLAVYLRLKWVEKSRLSVSCVIESLGTPESEHEFHLKTKMCCCAVVAISLCKVICPKSLLIVWVCY